MGFYSSPVWFLGLSVLGLAGCFSPPTASDSTQEASPPEAIAPPAPSPPADEAPVAEAPITEAPIAEAPRPVAPERPDTQIATLSVEGETEDIAMVLYDAPASPFTTYLPAGDFIGETARSDEGVGVRFTWTAGGTPNESVYLAFAFPTQPASLESLRESIVGEGGLISSNGWTVTETQTDALPADWAKEAIAFDAYGDADPAAGVILLGEHDGKMFYSILHYPLEYGEGFYPRATLILDHLEFKDESGS